MRGPLATLLTLLLLAPLAALPATPAPMQSGSAMGPIPVFELHSGFWINLHHFLYQQARQQREAKAGKGGSAHDAPPMASVSQASLSKAERAAWDAAVTYYGSNFADKDLLFNSDLVALKNQLGDFEDCAELSGTTHPACDAHLPAAFTAVLERAAPVYRAHWWTDHDRANRRWAARVAPLVRQRGLDLAQRLAEIYQARWPVEKIRVEVSAYANWAGAYTSLDPLRVTIASTDPRNQDLAGFEILFHESSHGLAGPVQEAIIRECRQRGKAIPRDLWHALVFYTTGAVVKSMMTQQENNPGDGAEKGSTNSATTEATPPAQPIPAQSKKPEAYVPYAVREGLYTRGWEGYQRLLERFWQPYLDGKADFSDAIARMVSSL